MPNHRSAAKRMRTSEKARQRNRVVKSQVKGALKTLETAADPEQADLALREAMAVLDRAARKGVLPEERVNRKKSRLARAQNRSANESG